MYRLMSAALVCALPFAAQAATYTYSFTATQVSTSLNNDLEGAAKDLQGFTALSGTFVFDDTPVVLPGPLPSGLAVFEPPVIQIDQFSLTQIEILPSFTVVANDFTSGTTTFDQIAGATSSAGPARLEDQLTFSLFDLTATVFSDLSFPTSIELSDFDGSALSIVTNQFDDMGDIIATDGLSYTFTAFDLVSTNTAPVPLPAGGAMLLGGIGALALAWRRSIKHR